MFREVKPLHAVKNNISFQHQLPTSASISFLQQVNVKFKIQSFGRQ